MLTFAVLNARSEIINCFSPMHVGFIYEKLLKVCVHFKVNEACV